MLFVLFKKLDQQPRCNIRLFSLDEVTAMLNFYQPKVICFGLYRLQPFVAGKGLRINKLVSRVLRKLVGVERSALTADQLILARMLKRATSAKTGKA